MEAEGGEVIPVAAVDLVQGVSSQGAVVHQLLVPAGGAPWLQLLLYTAQDLLVVGGGQLSTITPVHLQETGKHQDMFEAVFKLLSSSWCVHGAFRVSRLCLEFVEVAFMVRSGSVKKCSKLCSWCS